MSREQLLRRTESRYATCPNCGKGNGKMIGDDYKHEKYQCSGCNHTWETPSFSGAMRNSVIMTPFRIFFGWLFG